MIKKEVLEKIRNVGNAKLNEELKEVLNKEVLNDTDSLMVETEIDYIVSQKEKLNRAVDALESVRTFEELLDVLYIYETDIVDLEIVF